MSELDQVMAVMAAAFDPHWREAWSREQVAGSLGMSHTYAILVDADGDAVMPQGDAAGFILARRAPGEEELLLIAVRPEHRKKGLGELLIRRFCENARRSGAERVFLEMRANNPARSLYEACGFVPIGARKGYYRTVEGNTLDAITFSKLL